MGELIGGLELARSPCLIVYDDSEIAKIPIKCMSSFMHSHHLSACFILPLLQHVAISSTIMIPIKQAEQKVVS